MEQRFSFDDELAKKIENIIGVFYYNDVSLDDLKNIIEDLICEYHFLEEQLEEKEQYCRWYHKPIEKDDDEDIYLHRMENN